MTILSKYTLHEPPLGRGGYGTVYRAFDNDLKVERAVKVLHPQLAADPEFIARFRQEAQVAARLEHPHIIPVYDLGEDQGRFYLAMKYLSGGSLKELLEKDGHLSFVRALEILQQIAAALDFAYSQPEKLVHRDIKPGNILFEENGVARLADFGFAKALAASESASFSMSGGILGTPAYMAPETWESKPPTPAADVYSLACVFYEMITGVALFEGQSPLEIMRAHALEEPQVPDEWPEGVPGNTGIVLHKALAKLPQDRYLLAGDFATSIEALKTEEQSHYVAATQVAFEAESRTQREVELPSDRTQISTDEQDQPPQTTLDSKPVLSMKWIGLLAVSVIAVILVLVIANWPEPTVAVIETVSVTIPVGQATEVAVAVKHSKTPIPNTSTPMPPSVTPTSQSTNMPLPPSMTTTLTNTAVPTLNPNIPPACTEIGQTWVSPIDDMTLVCVTAGEFSMGSDDGSQNERPIHTVYLDAYWIGQTEVTNAMYVLCVADSACDLPDSTNHYNNSSYADHPVMYVSWHAAAAYCEWAGQRLPTEAEWEKAARGTDGRTYPWGEEIYCTQANYGKCVTDTSPVGSYLTGASPYGALDMAGNVWEWVADWYDANYYASSPAENPEGLTTGGHRVYRGGSWSSDGSNLRVANRYYRNPSSASHYIGFRCAYIP